MERATEKELLSTGGRMADDGERGSPLERSVGGGAAESAIIVTVTKERKLEIEGERAGERPRDCHWRRRGPPMR